MFTSILRGRQRDLLYAPQPHSRVAFPPTDIPHQNGAFIPVDEPSFTTTAFWVKCVFCPRAAEAWSDWTPDCPSSLSWFPLALFHMCWPVHSWSGQAVSNGGPYVYPVRPGLVAADLNLRIRLIVLEQEDIGRWWGTATGPSHLPPYHGRTREAVWRCLPGSDGIGDSPPPRSHRSAPTGCDLLSCVVGLAPLLMLCCRVIWPLFFLPVSLGQDSRGVGTCVRLSFAVSVSNEWPYSNKGLFPHWLKRPGHSWSRTLQPASPSPWGRVPRLAVLVALSQLPVSDG